MAGAIAARCLLASYLYGVAAGDPAALTLTIAILALVALTTLLIAVRRTPERDLISLLKEERR